MMILEGSDLVGSWVFYGLGIRVLGASASFKQPWKTDTDASSHTPDCIQLQLCYSVQ